jgi:hypothetical protein
VGKAEGTRSLAYRAESFLRSCQLCSYSRTSQHFKEPEGSSPCSQEPSTGSYPETNRSSPYHPSLSLLRSILYCPPTYVLVFLVVSFLLAFPPISYMQSSSSPFVLPSNLRNLKVHHRVHKSPPLVPILRQIDPVRTIPVYLS